VILAIALHRQQRRRQGLLPEMAQEMNFNPRAKLGV